MLRWINNTSSHLEEKKSREGPCYGGSTTPAATWWERDRGKAHVTVDQQHQQPPGGKEIEGRPMLRWINNTSSHLGKRPREGPCYGGSTTPAATWWERDRGKAHVTVDQQHQQPPGGKETEEGPCYGGSTTPAATWRERDRGKAHVTVDQQHQQPPGGKEHRPQRCNKNGRYKNRTRTVHKGES